MTELTRLDCMKLLGAGAIALGFLQKKLLAQGLPLPAVETLRAAAADRGLLYGSDSDVRFDNAPAEYRTLFVEQCALFAPNIWSATISPRPGTYDFSSVAADIQFAVSHGLKLTGAHLLWFWCLPDWITQLSGREAVRHAVLQQVQTVSSHYQGLAYSWNVVNEVLHPEDGRPDGLRSGFLIERIGPEYLSLAFRAARLGDPKALLVWNDADMELDTPEHEARRSALLKMLDVLQREDAPIDAIGLQSHMKWQLFNKFKPARYRGFLREVASRKLKILITELDVLDIGLPADIAERDRKVADVYASFLGTALDEPAVSAVVTWGLSNRYTWLKPESDIKLARPDGLPTRPLPFDVAFKPTATYSAILQAFKEAPKRSA